MVTEYLDHAIFPCTPSDAIRCAEQNGAPDSVLNAIENLPNKQYLHVDHVKKMVH